jgi:hypothetical protein
MINSTIAPQFSGYLGYEIDRGMFWLYCGKNDNDLWDYDSPLEKLLHSEVAKLNSSIEFS